MCLGKTTTFAFNFATKKNKTNLFNQLNICHKNPDLFHNYDYRTKVLFNHIKESSTSIFQPNPLLQNTVERSKNGSKRNYSLFLFTFPCY
jgi:hypothetical protein